jgi:quercetin dioxygenase-like cupin family protein
MRHLIYFFVIFLSISVSVKSQTLTDTTKTIFENNKFIVTEYYSTPGKDICGLGWHSHKPHLNILLTDAEVELTKKDGEPQNFSLKAGTTFWSEAETHMAINNGTKPIKLYIVEPKN